MSQVNTELGYSSTATISLNQTAVRTLAGVPSGAISMSNLKGKSNQFAFTVSSNQTNANLRTLAINAGWNQASQLVATINSGITISSSSTGTPALTINGSFPGGVQLINNGVIIGRGGNGGNGANPNSSGTGGAGGSGGLAVSVSSAVSINNIGRISGGGGGGGGGGTQLNNYGKAGSYYISGGGGGGGIGVSSGGAGGASGGGGNVGQAGAGGTLTAAGAGGKTGRDDFNPNPYYGGNGGSYGSNGTNGMAPIRPGAGGAAGGCLAGNTLVTWVAFGTRNGGIS